MLLTAGCGGPVDVNGTSTCGPFQHDDTDAVFHECVREATDSRVSGTSTVLYTYLGDVTWTGTDTLANDEGAWSGTFFGTSPDGSSFSIEYEMVGEGAYDGLTYTGTITGSFGSSGINERTGEGVTEFTGLITQDD